MTDNVVLAKPETRRRRGAGALYDPVGPILVRAPALPVDDYLGLTPDAPLNPLVRTALTVGSPDLLAQLDRKETKRARDKLLRYLIRMSTRPTPYGLFAAVGLAGLGTTTDLRITGACRTRTRPDMAWLLGFVRRLEARPEVRRELRVFANPAALKRGGRVRLAERATLGGDGAGVPVGIRLTGAVEQVLSLARAPISWTQLVDALLATPGATPEKAENLLGELFEQTFLLSELRPPLTHPNPAHHVAERLAGVAPAAAEHAALCALLDAMRDWDEQPVTNRTDPHRMFTAIASAANPDFDGTLVQVDTALAVGGGHLHERVAHEAAKAAELLLRVSPGTGGQLDGYRSAFLGRYGVEREVPLLELLDHEHGLGAPGPGHPGAGIDRVKLAVRNQTLLSLALNALRERRLEVELGGAALGRVTIGSPTVDTAPTSLDVAVFVLAKSTAAIDAGEFELLIGPNLGGQEAGRNFGRFGDLLGDAALSAIAAGQTGGVGVELVYLPHRDRSANVVVRPSVHRYEITTGTMPGVDPHHAIPLSEVMIGVRGGRFYARWPGVDGDLRVHAGHMLNPHQAPVAIRALEELARDGRTSFNSFHWGAAADLPFLPRLRVNRILLAAAQWQVDCAIRDAHLAPSAPDFAGALAAWRGAWMVPRHVYLAVADNRLLLDLEAPEQAELLRDELRRLPEGGALVLQEALPGPEHAWLAGPQGHHLTELVVPIALRAPPLSADEAHRSRPPAVPSVTERLRAPGSDWLFVKLYGPRDDEDALLTSSIRGLCQFVTDSGLADRWFFLRYADPEPHLRVRFGGVPDRLVQELFPRICEWSGQLLAAGICSRVAFDTYDREIERYGGLAAMGVAETLFAADSTAVVALLRLAESELTTIDRTTLGCLSVDALLAALGLDAPARLDWFRGRARAKHRSGDDYRERRGVLRRLLGDPGARLGEPGGPALERALVARAVAVAHAAARLRELERDGRLNTPFERLCESYVHLHCNRLLGAGPPTEQHLLGLLLRTYEGLQRAPVVAADPLRKEAHNGR